MALRRLLSSTLLKQHESYFPEVFCPEILLDMPPDGDPGGMGGYARLFAMGDLYQFKTCQLGVDGSSVRPSTR